MPEQLLKKDVSRPTLYKWKNQLFGLEVPASMKPHNDSPSDPERAELQRQVESLRRDVRQLQLEHDILKKANELLKKDLGVDLPLLTNREKTLLVDALRQTYALAELFAGLDFARSSYSYHRARLRGADKYGVVRRAIAPSQTSSSAITVATAIVGYGRHWAGSTSSSRRKSCSV